MVMKQATVTEVLDGTSFRLRTDAILVLDGVTPLPKGSDSDKKAKQKLADLVLKKKITTRRRSGTRSAGPRRRSPWTQPTSTRP